MQHMASCDMHNVQVCAAALVMGLRPAGGLSWFVWAAPDATESRPAGTPSRKAHNGPPSL